MGLAGIAAVADAAIADAALLPFSAEILVEAVRISSVVVCPAEVSILMAPAPGDAGNEARIDCQLLRKFCAPGAEGPRLPRPDGAGSTPGGWTPAAISEVAAIAMSQNDAAAVPKAVGAG
jgi:hypothetical protein